MRNFLSAGTGPSGRCNERVWTSVGAIPLELSLWGAIADRVRADTATAKALVAHSADTTAPDRVRCRASARAASRHAPDTRRPTGSRTLTYAGATVQAPRR